MESLEFVQDQLARTEGFLAYKRLVKNENFWIENPTRAAQLSFLQRFFSAYDISVNLTLHSDFNLVTNQDFALTNEQQRSRLVKLKKLIRGLSRIYNPELYGDLTLTQLQEKNSAVTDLKNYFHEYHDPRTQPHQWGVIVTAAYADFFRSWSENLWAAKAELEDEYCKRWYGEMETKAVLGTMGFGSQHEKGCPRMTGNVYEQFLQFQHWGLQRNEAKDALVAKRIAEDYIEDQRIRQNPSRRQLRLLKSGAVTIPVAIPEAQAPPQLLPLGTQILQARFEEAKKRGKRLDLDRHIDQFWADALAHEERDAAKRPPKLEKAPEATYAPIIADYEKQRQQGIAATRAVEGAAEDLDQILARLAAEREKKKRKKTS